MEAVQSQSHSHELQAPEPAPLSRVVVLLHFLPSPVCEHKGLEVSMGQQQEAQQQLGTGLGRT